VFEGADEVADVPPCIVDGALLGETHPVLDLGKCLCKLVGIAKRKLAPPTAS